MIPLDLGYQQLILDYPEIPHEIFGEINENYSNSFTINNEYKLLNKIILITFRQKYSPLFNIHLKELVASEIEPQLICTLIKSILFQEKDLLVDFIVILMIFYEEKNLITEK